MTSEEWVSLTKLFMKTILETIVVPCASKYNLSTTQYTCLRYIYLHPDSSVINISKAFSISTAAATTLVDRLVKIGLINRLPNPEDRRLVKLNLTEKGQDIFNAILNSEQEKWQILFDMLPQQSLHNLIESMTLVINLLLINYENKEKMCLRCGTLHSPHCPVYIISEEKNNLG